MWASRVAVQSVVASEREMVGVRCVGMGGKGGNVLVMGVGVGVGGLAGGLAVVGRGNGGTAGKSGGAEVAGAAVGFVVAV